MAYEDFNLDTLADYLHLTPDKVAKLAERGKLPGRKVSGEWRFSPAEIHHWLEERMGLLEEDELSHVETVLAKSAPDGELPLQISDLLLPSAISVSLPARSRRAAIDAMCEMAAETGMLWDADAMAAAVLAREELAPTALSNGVALLHPRRPMANILAEPFLALGITGAGIPFGGARGVLTDIFFLICSTDDRGHLRVLSRLSRLISDDDLLAELRAAPDATAVIELIADREAELSSV